VNNPGKLDSLLASVPWPIGLAARMIAGSSYPAGRPPAPAPLPPAPPLPGDVANAIPLIPPHNLSRVRRTLAEVIVARRSGGISEEGPLDQAMFGTLLAATAEPLPQPLLPDSAMVPIVCPVVFNVEGLPSAAYRYIPGEHMLISIRTIQREFMRNEVLLQWEHGSGAAVLFLVVPMARWLHAFGDRGYRGVAFQIGWLSDRLYLVAESLRLTYTASGGFSPAMADRLLGLDGYHYTSLFSFVVGGPKHRG
jgi:SagB-type dehydrogenase family enzyme